MFWDNYIAVRYFYLTHIWVNFYCYNCPLILPNGHFSTWSPPTVHYFKKVSIISNNVHHLATFSTSVNTDYIQPTVCQTMLMGCELRQIISLASVHYGNQCPRLTPRTLIPHNGHLLSDYLNPNSLSYLENCTSQVFTVYTKITECHYWRQWI